MLSMLMRCVVFVIRMPSLDIRRPTPVVGSGAVVQYSSRGVSPLFTVHVAETMSFMLMVSSPKSKGTTCGGTEREVWVFD